MKSICIKTALAAMLLATLALAQGPAGGPALRLAARGAATALGSGERWPLRARS